MMNKVTEKLGIEKPIIQGPLFWLTNAEMVAAVSNAGGMGTLGINAGQYPTDTSKNHNQTFKNMQKEIQKTKALTKKPFGINLIFAPDPDKDAFTGRMIELMAKEKVAAAVIYATKPISRWFNELHDNGIKIIYRPATPTKEIIEAGVQMGADIIVATGFDEGGTIPDKAVGTFSAVPYVVDIVNGRIPVMAAGGIVDARTAKAAFALGADGIFAGTAFLATEESPMADNIKQAVIEADAYDEVLFSAEPKYYRSLPGKLPNRLVRLTDEGKSKEEVWRAANAYRGMHDGMVDGDLGKGYASFGLGISFIHQIDSIDKVVDRIYSGVPEEQR